MELVGGVGVLVPAFSGLGALLLLAVDVGAFFAQVRFLHADWIHPIVIGAILAALICSGTRSAHGLECEDFTRPETPPVRPDSGRLVPSVPINWNVARWSEAGHQSSLT